MRMSNTSPLSNAGSVDTIYIHLKQQDIEQFYAGYQLWNLHQQIAALESEIDALQQQIRENAKCLQEVQPSAIALATLARLQANGVSNLDLLDRLLEQGEIWLDRMMQRLDYCEQLDDFIRDDYTQWCTHALEGAYDWIDSIQEGSPAVPPPVAAEETLTEATEELFLQKLSSDEDEDEASMLETTVKRPAITIPLAEVAALLEQPVAIEQKAAPMQEEQAPISDESYVGEEVAPSIEEYIPAADESAPEEELFTYTDEQPDIQEYLMPEETLPTEQTSTPEGEPVAIQDHAPFEEVSSVDETVTPEVEQPAIQEQVMTDFGDETPAAVIEEPALQEQVVLEELELPSQSEEPVVSAPIPSDVEKHGARVQASSPEAGGQHEQSSRPKRRPNFFGRLIRKIWGS
jgi:hypothetical protein